jgi:hypothetical protein
MSFLSDKVMIMLRSLENPALHPSFSSYISRFYPFLSTRSGKILVILHAISR